MKEKIFTFFKQIRHLTLNVYFALLTILMYCVFLELDMAIDHLPPTQNWSAYWSDFRTSMIYILFMLLGAVLWGLVLNWLVNKPKARIPFFATVVGLTFTLGPVLAGMGINFTGVLGTNIIGPLMAGVLSVTVVFGILALTHSMLIPVVLFLATMANLNSSGYAQVPQGWYLALFISAVLVAFGLLVYYFARFNGVRISQVRKVVNWRYVLLLFAVGALMFYIATLLMKEFNRISMALDDIRAKQFALQPQYGVPGQNDGNTGLDFGQRAVLLAPKVVGYYRAPHPIYLKTQVYRVNQFNYRLMITPMYMNASMYPQYQASTKHTAEVNSVKMIYAYGPDLVVPSAEKIINFQNLSYSDTTGLLQWPFDQTQHLGFLEYQYGLYDGRPKVTDSPTLGDITQADTNFTIVSPQSHRYAQIAELARSVTQNAKTDYDKARAIENYLIQNYEYTLTPDIKDLNNPVDEFLFDTKKGYCTHFATAMTVMLNSIGVKSRMVTGFYSDTYDPQLNVYIMLSTDLHAWDEVYINGYGWVTFDPTTYKLAPGQDPRFLTGGHRQLGGFSPDQLRSLLQPVQPGLSFDNLFDQRSTQGLPIAPDGTSFDQAQPEWKQTPPIDPKKQEELKKQQEELKKKVDDTKRVVTYVLIGVFAAGVLIAIGYWIYWRIKNKERLQRLKDQKTARGIDKKIGQFYLKRYKLPRTVLLLPHQKFTWYIWQYDINEAQLRRCFDLIDKILYAPSYQRSDIKELQQAARELFAAEKQKKLKRS